MLHMCSNGFHPFISCYPVKCGPELCILISGIDTCTGANLFQSAVMFPWLVSSWVNGTVDLVPSSPLQLPLPLPAIPPSPTATIWFHSPMLYSSNIDSSFNLQCPGLWLAHLTVCTCHYCQCPTMTMMTDTITPCLHNLSVLFLFYQ